MQVPGGQVNPGLSFFRAIQGLVQRPNQPGETEQQQSISRGTDPVSPQQRFAGDVERAARQADPNTRTDAEREVNTGTIDPAAPEAVSREMAGGGRMVPRGTFLDIRV